jgi:PAS domain S-box-containing protein
VEQSVAAPIAPAQSHAPGAVLRVLFLEDDPADVELCLQELKRAGLALCADVVQTPEDFHACLQAAAYDLILADYNLPRWTGMDALETLQSEGRDIPLVLVTGKLGEETAVECIKRGAADCVLKDRLVRLPLAVRRALQEKALRQERVRAEEKILRLNRLYSVLSNLGETIVRVSDRDQLLREVCRIAVEQGQFRMAWCGLLDPATQHIIPVAHCGIQEGCLEKARVSADQRTECPTGSALRTGQHFVCNDTGSAHCVLPWREDASRCAYRASAAFPIQLQGRVIGALSVYATEPGFFDEDNVTLLDQVAADVSFALESMEREAQRRRAEEERAQALIREEAARAQTRAEARFRELLEAAPDAILEIDHDDLIVLVNAATEKLFGYTREELLGQPVTKLIPERCREVYARLRGACLGDPASRVMGPEELSARRKNFSELFIEMNLSPVRTEQGNLITCIIRDITERKHLEEQLRQSQKMEAIGRLAGGVAHDFNNLLTIIGGYSQMLLDGLKAKDPARRDLEAIVEAANRASALTRQLLAFSRRSIVQPKILDLNRLIAKMHKMLRPVIGEDIELKLVLKKNLRRVKADPGQLEQVLMNLAVNARDAMPRGGQLVIETAEVDSREGDARPEADLAPGCYVLLAVRDSGHGMDAETRSHIFEPFFTTKARGKGTGLGLSTVYGIVKQSGGEITIESEVGQGAAFRIYLPAFEAPAKETELISPSRPPADGAETILLVEDEAGLRKLAREMLLKQGYRVVQASGGPEALRMWGQNPEGIDLLLTDVVMPQMSGRELADQLKAARPDLKVLYMSGYTHDVIARHGVLDSETAFLQKPFTHDALGRKVRALLDETR